jgi:hypothetical protein
MRASWALMLCQRLVVQGARLDVDAARRRDVGGQQVGCQRLDGALDGAQRAPAHEGVGAVHDDLQLRHAGA